MRLLSLASQLAGSFAVCSMIFLAEHGAVHPLMGELGVIRRIEPAMKPFANWNYETFRNAS
jgi:hypothetical protein